MTTAMGTNAPANPIYSGNETDLAIAKKRRERVVARQTYDAPKQSKADAKRTLPKHLQNVKSVIKNKVAIDRELGVARKMRGYSRKDPEVFVKSPPRTHSRS